jgi:ectoine hydroxylase-related dioxygenase (phytanoyl-CoA dioxygenase family)
MTMSSTSVPRGGGAVGDAVRAVTDDEVRAFHDNGWVLLRQLVAADLSAAIRERGAPRLAGLMDGSEADFATPDERRAHLTVAGASGEGILTDNEKWVEWRGAVRDAHDELFSRAALAPTMGRNIQRLLGRQRQMRVYHDIFMCKLPDGVSTPTEWHQDSVAFPLDRNALTVWIALDEITPDQGPVQFYSGSHRWGMLGRTAPDRSRDVLADYPELAELALSPPHHLQPGDATVHHGLVVHGAGANLTSRPRWSFAVAYFPSDARYTGAPNHDCDGFGLQVGQPIDHPSFVPVPA